MLQVWGLNGRGPQWPLWAVFGSIGGTEEKHAKRSAVVAKTQKFAARFNDGGDEKKGIK